MKATKKQIAEVTAAANEMNFSIELALDTLSFCSLSIYKTIGAKGVVESAMRANSSDFVDTIRLQAKADKMGVDINSLMTTEQQVANWTL